MKKDDLDLAIIGSGPSGLAAAVKARQKGIKNLVVFERDERPGGILPQCIHSGFGLEKFKEELTGPEYANRYIKMAQDLGIDIQLDSTVLELGKDRSIKVVSENKGIRTYNCKTLVLAMGCRERARGSLDIPGTRPAGIFTAGQAQRLINIEGLMPGKEAVILGSGDIGMIMARRLTLEGAQVKAVLEILPYTSGLIRNEVQCLHDFNIPLLLEHTVAEIHGEYRVEGVTVIRVDQRRNPIPGSERFISCDTLLLSVGLIPENELTKMAGLAIDLSSGGPYVDELMETRTPGLFACGNVLHVSDMVDNVSLEGELAAEGAFLRINDKGYVSGGIIDLKADSGISQVVPQRCTRERDVWLNLRVRDPMGKMKIHVGDIMKTTFASARPGEMIRVKIPKKALQELGPADTTLKLRCEEV
ncbi:MAG: FAD-dependent oxidoreductase [Desulfobacteraceae bacterium]|nr:FAD-dependent oxidoreductase [Desulfobacteraceae bacterium]